jgi:hypothetical protein
MPPTTARKGRPASESLTTNLLFRLGRRCQVTCQQKGDSSQLGDVAKQFLRYLDTSTRASPGEFRVGDDHALVSLL